MNDAYRTTVATDVADAAKALLAAIALRERAEPFDFAPRIGHPQADAAGVVASDLLAHEADPMRARERYDDFHRKERNARGDVVSTYATIPRQLFETLRQCAVLADRVVYRSEAEALRLNIALGLSDHPFVIAEPTFAGVPPPQARTPNGSIVVWAPSVPPSYLGVVRLALHESTRPIVVVDATTSDVVRADVLAHASLIVVPAHDDPGPAVGLAAWDAPLCAPLTSGVAEFLVGCTTYVPFSPRSIAEAIRTALGRPRARLRPAVAPTEPIVSSTFVDARAQDVLVLVRSEATTPADRLARTHASLRAQRAANVTIRDVVGSGTRRTRMLNAELDATSAAYLCVVDAGDELYPDHVSSLRDALERSRTAFAYAEMLIAHVTSLAARKRVGFSLAARRAYDPADFFVFDAMLAPMSRAMIRCDDVREAGGWNAFLAHAADHDLVLRLRSRSDFTALERVTVRVERSRDIDDAPAIGVLANDYRLLYELHRMPDRRTIADGRRAVLAFLANNRCFTLPAPPVVFE
jgi:hypothetical protein